MENKSSGYKIHEKGMLGEVKIADEVIAIIAGLAATEVKGVAGMCGNITNELVSKLGMKNLSKGVRVIVEEVMSVLIWPSNWTMESALHRFQRKYRKRLRQP